MVRVQKWLDENYPKKRRNEITELDIRGQDLEYFLDLSDFSNLIQLDCSDNYLTGLNITSCRRLERLICNNNFLTNLVYPSNLNTLTYLDLSDNNFSRQTLVDFSRFTNLNYLRIGNKDKERISNNIYNSFYGSLWHLKKLNKLTFLDISNTDISIGFKYLPNGVKKIFCSTKERPESGVKVIKKKLFTSLFFETVPENEKESFYFSRQSSWREQKQVDFNDSKAMVVFKSNQKIKTEKGLLKEQNAELERVKKGVEQLTNEKNTAKEKNMVNAQGWLDKNYSKEGTCQRKDKWKVIHWDLQNRWNQDLWTNHGFDCDTTKQWANDLENFNPATDWAFCAWLRDDKHLTPQQIQNNVESLRTEYDQLWTTLHPDFAKDLGREITATKQKLTCQQLWETWGFTREEMQQLVNTGLQPQETYFGFWLASKKQVNKLSVLNAEQLWKEYNSWTCLHLDFTLELKQEWIKWFWDEKYAYRTAQDWINAGLEPAEAQFAKWLEYKNYISNEKRRHEVSQIAENQILFQATDKPILKQEYLNSWGLIHPGFAKWQQDWEQADFTYQNAKEWVTLGFEPENYSKVKQWKDQSLDPTTAKPWVEAGIRDYYEVKQWKKHHFTLSQAKSWLDIGLKPTSQDDHFNYNEFATYLRYKDYQPSPDLNWQSIKDNGIQAQEWLDAIYPQEQRSTLLEKLGLSEKNLQGGLDLSDFINLKELYCIDNQLTSLNLSNCCQLEKICCPKNQLTKLTLPNNLTNLRKLILYNNNFNQDLAFLSKATSLAELDLSNNQFRGSLDYLTNLKQLKWLKISDTNLDIDNTDKLPRSLKYVIGCKPIQFGWCSQCTKPNTSENTCHDCSEKDWQQDLKHLTGQELVEKFIAKQQTKETKEYNKLKWVPYEQFTNITHLADGGFSEIYKATWTDGPSVDISGRIKSNQEFALKVLNNSQNITLDLLSEIANIKLVNWTDRIVHLYGLSQDPKTKKYVMVMQYIDKGNLRQYLLQSKNEQLSFGIKSGKLNNIALGLSDIHNQNLVHQDFHSGNILNSEFSSHITDLGLSRPADKPKEEGWIFGVLPYVAPEVLRGKPYTQKSDIYSFGIITYELLAQACPYYYEHEELKDLDDDSFALRICNGLRPKLDKIPIPQLLKDFIKRCWDADPLKRPNADELFNNVTFNNPLFNQQCQMIENEYDNFSKTTLYRIHPTTITTSKPINTKEIARLFQESKEKEALELEIKKIEREVDQPFTVEQKELVEEFIQVHKKRLKNKKDKEARKKIKELKEKLEKKDLSEENIEKIIKYCERFDLELQVQVEIPTNN